MYITLDYRKIRESIECSGPMETSMGYKRSADLCAKHCERRMPSSKRFIYGKSSSRCNEDGCACYYENMKNCDYIANSDYDLYLFGYSGKF